MPSPMTMTEKILAAHAGTDHVQPGENVWVNVDVLMTHDVCGPGTIGIFKERFGKNAKVWDPDRVVIIPDHYIFTADKKCHRNIQILRDFVREQGLRYYYDPDFVTSEPNMPSMITPTRVATNAVIPAGRPIRTTVLSTLRSNLSGYLFGGRITIFP